MNIKFFMHEAEEALNSSASEIEQLEKDSQEICHHCHNKLTPVLVEAGGDLIEAENGHNEDCPLLDF